jgi:hypothetical protein
VKFFNQADQRGIIMPEDMMCWDVYRLLKRVVGLPVAGDVSAEATAGLLSHLFTLALTGDTGELEAWLLNEAVLQSWVDGQTLPVASRADNDLLPGYNALLAATA